MIARRAVFAHPRVTALLERFVAATDEVGRLQRGQDPESLLFQQIAEQGHYAGRSVPTSTRQGLYAATANGRLLASINHNDPVRVAAMLERALAAWDALPPAERAATDGWDGATGRQRLEARYPVGGLALRVTTRDLPREGAPEQAPGWHAQAWNLDTAWFQAEEARAFVPSGAVTPGSRVEVPAPLLDRLVRLHLLDNVRGQTYPAPPKSLEQAQLAATVTGTYETPSGAGISLTLAGSGRWSESGRWPIGGHDEPQDVRRGVEVRLEGRAEWNLGRARFDSFVLLAHGTRWGGTQYNSRHDDLGPAPIAWLFELAGDSPAERIAPASIWQYPRR